MKLFSKNNTGQGKIYRLLLDYSYKRSFSEAFIFYISHFIFIIGSVIVVGKIINLFIEVKDPLLATNIALIIILGVLAYVSYCLLKARNSFTNPLHLGLVALALILSYVFGLPLGLIPLAYLTMQEKNKKE